MIPYHNIDPIALQLGPLKIHWYGLMYLLGFWGCWWLLTRRGRMAHVNWSAQRCSDVVFYVVMGVILGGRIGYTLFYNFSGFLADPLVLVRIWQGGMSFHGGVIGVTIVSILFAKKNHQSAFSYLDIISLVAPIGIFFGRVANFINSELYGKETSLPWGVKFLKIDNLSRHPSQLYEAFFEGILLFVILIYLRNKTSIKIPGFISAICPKDHAAL